MFDILYINTVYLFLAGNIVWGEDDVFLTLGVVMAANPEVEIQLEVKALVLNAVVHDLLRMAGGAFSVECSKAELNITATTSKVVGRLVGEYAKRSGKAHGQFEADEVNFPVQQFVRQFYETKTIDFMGLTEAMMKTLHTRASKTAAGGGHVVFAYIYHEGIYQLLVAIVTEEWGAALGNDKDFADTAILDLKGFRFAGRIDLNEWQKGGDKYLSFLKGRSNEVSGYFKLFLGCDSSITDSAETRTLKAALDIFASESGMEDKQRSDFFSKAYEICSVLNKAGDPIDLQTFANELWPGNPPALMQVMGREELKLSDGFVPDKRALKAFVQFAGKTKAWEVKFARKAMLDGDVVFNDDESLTLYNLPAELKERLRKEIKDEEEDE
ncbi:nucleoid-associated protein [Pseudoduganella sp. LjRoot289]|uniref:nucleoid-associated protein n=1 Tax=Pseudoduganella sp. LjRoot289 TaxID=3342314 RepID=UPI003ECD1A31